jgi:hypothetical protein
MRALVAMLANQLNGMCGNASFVSFASTALAGQPEPMEAMEV